jgi:hypothetical protein
MIDAVPHSGLGRPVVNAPSRAVIKQVGAASEDEKILTSDNRSHCLGQSNHRLKGKLPRRELVRVGNVVGWTHRVVTVLPIDRGRRCGREGLGFLGFQACPVRESSGSSCINCSRDGRDIRGELVRMHGDLAYLHAIAGEGATSIKSN